jgi:anti-sigma regulatory factor (Ser/Thr protein kinase)
MEVGGDWYDVVPLADGAIGVVIGDVAGHGLRAAAIMGQLRMSLRAYAAEERSPSIVMRRVHGMAARLGLAEMATLIYLVFDPDEGSIRYANAGHPPPLVIAPDGATHFLRDGLSTPLGAGTPDGPVEAAAHLGVDSTLVLYTDGLVERRGTSIHEGLERLRAEGSAARADLEGLCDHLIESMVGEAVADDVAIVALRPMPIGGGPLVVRVPAEPRALAMLRQASRRWLRAIGASQDVVNDVLIAAGEACSNVIQHAYGAGEGTLEFRLAVEESSIEITVVDQGAWRRPFSEDGGRGLVLMRGFMEDVEVQRGPGGTVVRMRRRLDGPTIEEGTSRGRARTDRG